LIVFSIRCLEDAGAVLSAFPGVDTPSGFGWQWKIIKNNKKHFFALPGKSAHQSVQGGQKKTPECCRPLRGKQPIRF
jgi:hypothetical protein